MTHPEFKEKCIELRNKNLTLGEIVLILDRPKTSIFWHIRNIPKSRLLKKKISSISSKYAKLNIIRGLTPQKGESALGRKYKDFKEWTPSLVNLVAHAVFDGEIKYGGVIYHNRCGELVDNFKSKMKIIYDFDPKFIIKKGDVKTISYHNVELGRYFKLKKDELLKSIFRWSIEFQREFLKAFFDDEGSVGFHMLDHRRQVRGFQHNNRILYLVQNLLKNFGIDSKVDARFHEIIISRRENIDRYAKEINFSKGLRVNGKRSNSIWKKSLEKRKILADLLTSYQKSRPSGIK